MRTKQNQTRGMTRARVIKIVRSIDELNTTLQKFDGDIAITFGTEEKMDAGLKARINNIKGRDYVMVGKNLIGYETELVETKFKQEYFYCRRIA